MRHHVNLPNGWRIPIDRLDVPIMILIALVLLFAGVRFKVAAPLWIIAVVLLWVAGRRMRRARSRHDDREQGRQVWAWLEEARRIRRLKQGKGVGR